MKLDFSYDLHWLRTWGAGIAAGLSLLAVTSWIVTDLAGPGKLDSETQWVEISDLHSGRSASFRRETDDSVSVLLPGRIAKSWTGINENGVPLGLNRERLDGRRVLCNISGSCIPESLWIKALPMLFPERPDYKRPNSSGAVVISEPRPTTGSHQQTKKFARGPQQKPAKRPAGPDKPTRALLANRWVLEIGYYPTAQHAEPVMGNLQRNGYHVGLDKVASVDGDQLWLWVGPYAEKQEAIVTKNRLLRDIGQASHIVAYQ